MAAAQSDLSVPDDKVRPMQAQREADADAGRAPPAQDEMDPDIIPHDQLRKYIAYAKGNCRPKLQNADYDKIAQVCPCAIAPISVLASSVPVARASVVIYHGIPNSHTMVCSHGLK